MLMLLLLLLPLLLLLLLLGGAFFAYLAIALLPFAYQSSLLYDRKFFQGEYAAGIYPVSAYYAANITLEVTRGECGAHSYILHDNKYYYYYFYIPDPSALSPVYRSSLTPSMACYSEPSPTP